MVRFVRTIALSVVTAAMLAGTAEAEEPSAIDAEQVKALIDRLESAEKQIQELNAELQKVKSQSLPPAVEPAPVPATEEALPLRIDNVFEAEADSLAGRVSRFSRLTAFEEPEDEPADLEGRLGIVEEGLQKIFDAENKKKSDAAKKPTFKIGGRIHADYWDFVHNTRGIDFLEHPDEGEDNFGASPEDRFLFRRIRLEMSGDILETMLWRMQVDFNNPGTPELKDVYLGFKELPHNQQLLIGIQKRPIGLDHLNSSRFNVFVERPFVVEAFNEDARRPGIAMYGYTEDESIHWRYGAYFLENISRDGRVIGNSSQMSLNGRISGSPWYDDTSGGRGYFHWAVSGMYARPDGDADSAVDDNTNSNEGRFRTRVGARTDERWLNTGRIDGATDYEILGLESILNVGPFQAVGEYQHSWLQRDAGSAVQFHGGYFYLSYFLTGEHIPYSRKTGTIGRVVPFENFFLVENCCGGRSAGWGAWNVALRYDYLDLTDDDILGGIGEAWTGVVNWWWTPYSRVQMSASYGDIREHELVGPTGGTMYDGGSYFLFGTRFAVDF